MAEVKLTIEEENSSSLLAAEKQKGQQKGLSKDGGLQQQADSTANPSPPSTMSEFYQQIAKLNIGRFKLFTWFALLAAFISLSNGQSTIRRKSSENYYGDIVLYTYESTYPNPVWNRAMSMHFVLLVISTGSLLFHWIQRCMSKCLVTLALTDICLALFSTVVLSIQCWQIMVGHVSVNWDHGTSFPLSLNFVIWCTSAMAIVLSKVCFCRTISALKQNNWSPSNYATAHPGCSALDAAYARFWPIGLQKLAQMLIGAFIFMLILIGAVGPDNRDDYNLIFGIYSLVCLFQWAFHAARTRFSAKETSAGLALACFVDCLLSGLGLLFQMVIYYNFPTPFRATVFTWLSLICGSMFAFTICFNLLLLFRHRNAIGANIAAIWGKLIKHLRKYVPRSVPVSLRISVSVNFTVIKKDEEEEEKAKNMNNDADDNKDVEAAAIGDEEEKKADEKKVEEDGKMKKEENGDDKKKEDDDKDEEEIVKKVVEEKPNEEDGISFEEVLEEGGEEDAYCIV